MPNLLKSEMNVNIITDGRRARGERTRVRVLEALVALAEEGQVRPGAQQVADRAGVALRTVYHHFSDVDELRRMALIMQLTRGAESLRSANPAGPLADRIKFVAHELRRQFEMLTPIRRVTVLDEFSSPATEASLREYRTLRRDYIATVFATEIRERKSEGRTLLDALDAATTWEAWDYMRLSLNRAPLAAERTLALTLTGLLGRPLDAAG